MKSASFYFKSGSRSLKTQLALYFIPATLLPVIGLSYYATHTFEKNGQVSITKQAQTEFEWLVEEIDTTEKNLAQQTRKLSVQAALIQAVSAKKELEIKKVLGSVKSLGQVRVYDPEGDFISEGPRALSLRPQLHYLTREALKRIKSQGTVTERYFNPDGLGIIFLSRSLIQDENRLYGIVEQEYLFGKNQLSDFRRSRGVESLLIKRDFSSSVSSLSIEKGDLKKLASHSHFDNQQGNRSFQTIWLGDIRYATYLFNLSDPAKKNPTWAHVNILVPLTQFDSATGQSRLNIIMITLLLASSFGYLIFIFSKQIVKPIEILVTAMKGVKTGSLEEIPASESSYEIEYLINTFNEMIRNVSATRKALESKIVELKDANNEIRDTQSALIQSAKMISMGQIVAGVAHELNNPLAFIYSNMHHLTTYIQKITKVFAEYQRMKAVLPPEIQKQIDQMEKDQDIDFVLSDMPELTRSCLDGANRTKEIVMGLRTFSRMDESVFKPSDIHEGIRSTLRLLNAELKNRIVVHEEFGDIPLVECSLSQINQVLMNLFANAAQAIEGIGNIWIRTRQVGESVEIEIEDSGSGMDNETMSHIFVPFFTTKKVGEGTGLGLSIAYGLIQKHQGNIEVTSFLGKGTKFKIILPIKQTQVKTG